MHTNIQLNSKVAILQEKIVEQDIRIAAITQRLALLSRQSEQCAYTLKRCISLQESAAERDPLTHESTIMSLESQIDSLRRQRDLHRKLAAHNTPTVITVSKLSDMVAEIQLQIKMLFDTVDRGLVFSPERDLDDVMKQLIQYSGICSIEDDPEAYHKFEKTVEAAGAWNVLRTIGTAAVCCWVFQTDFPNVDENQSSLLEIYRRKLRSLSGKCNSMHLTSEEC
jgi:hypothetical protein